MGLKETFLKKYGVWEYVIFLLGLVFLSRVGYSVVVADFKEITWEEIAVIVTFLSLGILSVAAPQTIVDLAKNKSLLRRK